MFLTLDVWASPMILITIGSGERPNIPHLFIAHPLNTRIIGDGREPFRHDGVSLVDEAAAAWALRVAVDVVLDDVANGHARVVVVDVDHLGEAQGEGRGGPVVLKANAAAESAVRACEATNPVQRVAPSNHTCW